MADQKESAEDRVNNVRRLYSKYLSHGQADHHLLLEATDKHEKSTKPAAFSFQADSVSQRVGHGDKDVCAIQGIRTDYYGTVAESLGTSADMRAFLLIHEDTHCRAAAPTSMKGISGISSYATLVNESVADAMGVAMIARRDGAERAIGVADNLIQIRGDRAENMYDYDHDSREALHVIKDIILNRPEKFSSDESAFIAAIEAGVAGADKQIPDTSQVERDLVAKSMSKAIDAYKNGPARGRPASIMADQDIWPMTPPRSIADIKARITENSAAAELPEQERDTSYNLKF